MLYILPIDSYTIKFHDNKGHSQIYGIDLEAHADSLGRIWIIDTFWERNVLNSCKVSDIAFWNGVEYVTYETAAEFVDAFNEITTPVTTTTTTVVMTTTTTTGIPICEYGLNNSAVYI